MKLDLLYEIEPVYAYPRTACDQLVDDKEFRVVGRYRELMPFGGEVLTKQEANLS